MPPGMDAEVKVLIHFEILTHTCCHPGIKHKKRTQNTVKNKLLSNNTISDLQIIFTYNVLAGMLLDVTEIISS